MNTRKVKDAKDISTNELIYFKSHAQSTYMSDGTTVEDAIPTKVSQLTNDSGYITSDDLNFSGSAEDVTFDPAGTGLTSTNVQDAIAEVKEAGVADVTISVDNTSGIPSASAVIENQVLKIELSGLKGEQGNSGFQGDFTDFEVVNNLADGGADKALSAEMGKLMGEDIYGASNYQTNKYLDADGLIKEKVGLCVSDLIPIDSSLHGKRVVVNYGSFSYDTSIKVCVEYASGSKVDVNAQTENVDSRESVINSGVDNIRITFREGYDASVVVKDTGDVLWQAGANGGLLKDVRELEEEINAIVEGGGVVIVNNLADGGADKALSAEMGKELGQEVGIKFKIQSDTSTSLLLIDGLNYSEDNYTYIGITTNDIPVTRFIILDQDNKRIIDETINNKPLNKLYKIKSNITKLLGTIRTVGEVGGEYDMYIAGGQMVNNIEAAETNLINDVKNQANANYYINKALNKEGNLVQYDGICTSNIIPIDSSLWGKRVIVDYGTFDYDVNVKILVEYGSEGTLDSNAQAEGSSKRSCVINEGVEYVRVAYKRGHQSSLIVEDTEEILWESQSDVTKLNRNLESLDIRVKSVEDELYENKHNFELDRYLNASGGLVPYEGLCVSEYIPISSALQGKRVTVYYGEFAYNTEVKVLVEYSGESVVDKNAQTDGSTKRSVVINQGVDRIRITFLKGIEATVVSDDTGEVLWSARTNLSIIDSLKNIEDKIKGVTLGDCLTIDNGWRTSKIVNPKADLQRKDLKILEIGNSFTNFPTLYVNDIVNNAVSRGTLSSDMDVAFYKLTRSGSSFHDWCNIYHNLDTPSGTDYYFSKVRDDKAIIGRANDESCDVTSNQLMLKVLTSYKWDLILIHQRSVYSGESDLWESHEDAGYLREFIMILKKYQPQASIGTTLVHAPAKKSGGYNEANTVARWENIARGVAKMQAEYGVDIVVPWGTALENLRLSSIRDEESDLTHDLHHPAHGLVCYSLSLVYFQCIFGSRYGVSLMDDTFTKNMSSERESATYPMSIIDINDETRPLAKAAAMLACYGMYSINNPEDYLGLWL